MPETTSTLTAEGRRLGVGPSVLLVLVAFLLGQVPLLVATATTEHPDPPIIADPIDALAVETWGRYDTWLYLEVARSGPSLYHCSPEYWPPEEWCGNSGWLPLYPGIVRATSDVTGLTVEQAGAIVARAAFLGELALVWFAVLRRRLSTATVLALLLGSTAAGAVWLVAIFPMSLAVLLTTASVVLLARRRELLAGLAAGLAATSHTMGIIAVGVGGLCILLGAAGADGPRTGWRETTERLVRFTLPAAACYLLMLGWYQWTVDEWSAPFLSQRKYGHGVQNPVAVVVERVVHAVDPPEGLSRWQFVQSALVAVTAVAVAVTGITRWDRLEVTERYLVVAALAFWIIPLAYGGELASYYRLEALAMPATALTWRLPRWFQAALLGAFAVTSYHVAQGFFIGVLI